jgi:fermentation-respiration switch protein FrsA (DUF1100 family)
MTLIGIAFFVLLLASTVLGTPIALQRKIIYPRPPAPATPPALPPGARALQLGADRDVEGWFLRPPQSVARFPLVIFMHGNGELIDHWLAPFWQLAQAGVGVVLVEYPGYGRSGGTPSQDSITEVVVSAFDAGSQMEGVDQDAIIAYGRSLGGGAACQLAAMRPVAALILESTFTSLSAIAGHFGLPAILVLDPFDNLEVVSSLEIPIMVIHGEYDDLIPIREGETLAEAANTPLLRLRCGHNDCPRPWSEILAFLDDHELLR